jgi:hypothetical protein
MNSSNAQDYKEFFFDMVKEIICTILFSNPMSLIRPTRDAFF